MTKVGKNKRQIVGISFFLKIKQFFKYKNIYKRNASLVQLRIREPYDWFESKWPKTLEFTTKNTT